MNEMPSGSGSFGSGSFQSPKAPSTTLTLSTRKSAYLNTIRTRRFPATDQRISRVRRSASAAAIALPSMKLTAIDTRTRTIATRPPQT